MTHGYPFTAGLCFDGSLWFKSDPHQWAEPCSSARDVAVVPTNRPDIRQHQAAASGVKNTTDISSGPDRHINTEHWLWIGAMFPLLNISPFMSEGFPESTVKSYKDLDFFPRLHGFFCPPLGGWSGGMWRLLSIGLAVTLWTSSSQRRRRSGRTSFGRSVATTGGAALFSSVCCRRLSAPRTHPSVSSLPRHHVCRCAVSPVTLAYVFVFLSSKIDHSRCRVFFKADGAGSSPATG